MRIRFITPKMVVIGLILFTLFASPLSAQEKQDSKKLGHIAVPIISPRSEDISTLDGIMKAFYETISGPVGQPRQWGRDRTLYISGVRFVSTGVQDGKPFAKVVDHQQYVDDVNEELVQKGFFEQEIHRVVKIFGNITHVFSTYESRYTLNGPVIARGINSIELFNDGKRWWIAAAIWDIERPDSPIPSNYLPQ